MAQLPVATRRNHYRREVPPEVTTGRVVVVVGGRVAAVGAVVGADGGAVSGDDGVVAPPDVVVVVVVPAGALEPAVDPGCSFATTSPMHTVAPPASTTASLVSLRTRAWARARRRGEQ